ncbi:hypothetical protein CHS0354_023591 [Potamilus streckersoni]|uniref:Sodium channel and clathrin linker 1 n=1 Tax=Potamilus streckersoni TaxID=2493646 RepID=A0AAE0SN08_9BIVA|nr:hypothetical protein CHS0354_023591 [Potamilus streckersoni]
MASEEINFLKNQVQRLNAELSKYRKQIGELRGDTEGPLPEDAPPAPWLTDKSLLSPLLAEYDQQIQEMQHQLSEEKDELSSLKVQISKLVAENERLTSELKQSVAGQLESVENGDGDAEPVQNESQAIQNFQRQVEIALDEKEMAVQRWHEAEQEIDRLRQHLLAEKGSHQWNVIERQAQQMHSEYFETVTQLNKEIEELQNDNRNLRQELETATIQNKELKITNKEMETQLGWKDHEISEVIFNEGIADTRLTELKLIIEDLRKKVSSRETEIEVLKRDKGSLEVQVAEMRKRSSEVEKRELDSVSQMREAVQMVENAMLEKEQAEGLVQQREEEIEQFKEVINKLINEAGARTRQEVDNVRVQCNEKITKLTEEVQALEMDNADKQDQVERAMREKRAVEAELEKVVKEGLTQIKKDKDTYELVNQRAIIAERIRDDALMKVEYLENQIKREQINSQQLQEQLENQLTQTKIRISQLEQEFEHLNEDRVQLIDELDNMKKRLQAAQQEKEAAQRKCEKEMTISEQEQNMKIRDYEVKLQTVEDTNRSTMAEIRKLLTAQQRMTARWKEECTTVAQKYEVNITDLRGEINQLKKRNQELTSLLKESQEKTLEAEKMIADYSRAIRRIEERMRDSENRAAELAKKLSRQMMRERQIENEKRSLRQELQRSVMDSSNNSPRHDPDELTTVNLASSLKPALNGSLRKSADIDDAMSDR